ncbi:10588_t:CDS:2 [Funneliformis caledonium]|uniref:10588_t:CDS:1 n=1 Tax=Funneliformis caledonium TaxID=1117310 RepID=A0A9N9CKW5_9GLOM|nr:10588_t:CDS:2 [Funneliformis caledonium]
MPLKDWDTKEALCIFENNIHLCDKNNVPKSDFKFLACSEAAGIGMAYQKVLRGALPTGYSFKSVKCPLLTLKAIFEIVDHFAVEDKQ